MIRGTRLILLFASIVATIAMLFYVSGNGPKAIGTPAGNVRRFSTPNWSPHGMLALRLQSGENRRLLMRNLTMQEYAEWLHSRKPEPPSIQTSEPIYQFDPVRKSLSVVPQESWEDAAKSTTREYSSGMNNLDWNMDPRDHVLYYQHRPFHGVGKHVIEAQYAPNSNSIVVLSADGPLHVGLIPFVGGVGADGTHYLELFDMKTALPISEPVSLPFTTREDAVRITWSPEQQFIVFSNDDCTWVTIVDMRTIQQ